MGFSISWLAIQGASRTDLLAREGLEDTGQPDDGNECPFSAAALPDGWTVLFSNDFDYTSPKRLARLSRDCTVVACQVEEHVMFSAARLYEHGFPVWSLEHDSSKGIYDLSVAGSLPVAFSEIRERLTKLQKDEKKGMFRVDYIFDIPVEMAAATCGFRHDRWKFDWGEPKFSCLQAAQ